MKFLDWMLGRAASIEDPAPDLPPLRWDRSRPPAPAVDDPETITVEIPKEDEPLENLFCEIEYEDAGGNLTSRQVTFISLTRRYHMPSIIAVCHFRRAVRTFRTDRIATIITADGEVFDGPTFLTEVMRLDLRPRHNRGAVDRPPRTPEPKSLAPIVRDFRDVIISPLTVLVACGKADGHLHVDEVDRIMSWAEKEAMHLHRAGAIVADLTIDEADALGTTIKGMRPQVRTLKRHVAVTLAMPPEALSRFRKALHDVIVADGRIHGAEESFLADFDELARNSASLDLADRYG